MYACTRGCGAAVREERDNKNKGNYFQPAVRDTSSVPRTRTRFRKEEGKKASKPKRKEKKEVVCGGGGGGGGLIGEGGGEKIYIGTHKKQTHHHRRQLGSCVVIEISDVQLQND